MIRSDLPGALRLTAGANGVGSSPPYTRGGMNLTPLICRACTRFDPKVTPQTWPIDPTLTPAVQTPEMGGVKTILTQKMHVE